MKRIVVDSTVCLNWFIQPRGKRERTAALELLDQVNKKIVHVVQPAMWRVHVTAMLRQKRRVDARRVMTSLLAVEAREQNTPEVQRLAMEMAMNLDADVFDTFYHAVAVDKDIELVTTNADYAERAGHLGHIRLLVDWIAHSRIAERDKHYSGRRSADAPQVVHKKR